MILRRLLISLILLVTCIAPVFAAQAPAGPKSLGNFGAWRTFLSKDSGQTVCYMALKTQGTPLRVKKAKRGPVLLMITQRPAENTRDVVSYGSGYIFKAGTDMRIGVGKANFSLFTQKDTAWSRDAMTDRALAAAIIKSPTLTAIGTPGLHGAGDVRDTIPLKGAAEAYRAIGKACGIALETPAAPVKARKKTSK